MKQMERKREPKKTERDIDNWAGVGGRVSGVARRQCVFPRTRCAP